MNLYSTTVGCSLITPGLRSLGALKDCTFLLYLTTYIYRPLSQTHVSMAVSVVITYG